MKVCPYCAEQIASSASTCPYCDSQFKNETRIADNHPRGPQVASPPCPRCRGQLMRASSSPFYLGVIGLMLVKPVVCTQCGHEFDARKPKANLNSRKRNLMLLLNGIGCLGIVAVITLLMLLIISTT